MNLASQQLIYAKRSAMHIPAIVLGYTNSSISYINSLLQAKKFSSDEVEFFADYTQHLVKGA